MEHRCPHCLNLPLSVAIDCPHCRGTGLKVSSIKRPGLPAPVSADLGMCETCWKAKTQETRKDPHNPLKSVVRTFCGCGLAVAVVYVEPEKARPPSTVSLLFDEISHADYCAQLKRDNAQRFGLIPTQWGYRRPKSGELAA